jgi:hypothetical protein
MYQIEIIVYSVLIIGCVFVGLGMFAIFNDSWFGITNLITGFIIWIFSAIIYELTKNGNGKIIITEKKECD